MRVVIISESRLKEHVEKVLLEIKDRKDEEGRVPYDLVHYTVHGLWDSILKEEKL